MEDREQLRIKKSRKTYRNKGATLAEFALTLPILLILIFGIIEFGRIFQAWVTLQNSAREATRYATTGQYDEDRYDIDVVVPCPADAQGRDVVDLGTPTQQNPDPIDSSYAFSTFEGGQESLYATWYQGQGCDPTNPSSLDDRRDILRLVSIMDEARRAAAGLSLGPNPLSGTEESVRNTLYGIWNTPQANSNERGWFNVVICSSRTFRVSDSTSYSTGPTDVDTQQRFIMVSEAPDPIASYPEIEEAMERYDEPFCLMNEHYKDPANGQPAPNNVSLTSVGNVSHHGLRWLDAGDPGDRVNLVVTFNHPLITPLGLADYIQMEARRSGIVESFRVNAALASSVGGAPGAGTIDTPTPLPASDTPEPTATYTPTSTATVTPSASPTSTTAPFTCQGLVAQDVSFFGDKFFVELENLNAQSTHLVRVELRWRIDPNTEYQDRYLAATGVNSETYWVGNESGGTGEYREQDSAVATGASDLSSLADTTIPSGSSFWEGLFLNSGGQLSAVFNDYDFGGTVFYFADPENGGVCPITIQTPPVPNPADATDPPPGSTDTYTPDCASSNVSVQWVGFDSFGVVTLRIVNNRPNAVADLQDFSITWPSPESLGLSPGIFNLDKITIGGNNPDDPSTTVIWQGPDSDQSPPTLPSHGSGLLTVYSFAPNSSSNLYLDFSGTGSDLRSAFGAEAYMFNGTWFNIGCGRNGGSNGGGGGGNSGVINLATSVPPPPTRTPRDTNTPGPTRTPTPTRPTNTPSNTWTPGPTRTPSNTPEPSLTPSNTPPQPPPTPDTSGGGE